MTVGFEVDAAAKENHRTDCEHLLWRTVRGLSQTEASGPFSAPALSEFEWDEQLVPIVSGDTALVVTGSYMFDDVHTPCRWKNDCCSTESVIYLNSCRAPTEEELQVIQSCLTKAGSPRSGEFAGCLRSSAVKTGCEVQPDGSQLCY
jgi:hypothetical protein